MASEGAIAKVETYTTMEPVGVVTQEYKGMLVVSKVGVPYYLQKNWV